MSINRRQILKAAGVSSIAAGAAPLNNLAFASDAPSRQLRAVLQTGLDTDLAFAEGLQADHVLSLDLTPAHYEHLVGVLTAIESGELFALVEPAQALLIEQAARDVGMRLRYRQKVEQPADVSPSQWAGELGQCLASGETSSLKHSHSSAALVAVSLRV
jgi:hypothetical protein